MHADQAMLSQDQRQASVKVAALPLVDAFRNVHRPQPLGLFLLQMHACMGLCLMHAKPWDGDKVHACNFLCNKRLML